MNGAELQQILRDLQRKVMTEIFVTLQDELFELLTLQWNCVIYVHFQYLMTRVQNLNQSEV